MCIFFLPFSQLPGIWCIAAAMVFVTVLLPRGEPVFFFFRFSMFPVNPFLMFTELNTESLLYLLFWSGMAVASSFFIVANGPEFVDWPKLVQRFQLPKQLDL